MSIHRPPTVASAHKIVTVECRRVAEEIDAFERFVARVRNLPAESQVADGGTVLCPPLRTVTSTDETASFRAVCCAYRQTVLSVAHWEEAYGESTVAESMVEEFSPALAQLMTRPGTARFTRPLRTHLVAEGHRAIGVRRRALGFLEGECVELGRLQPALESITEQLAEIRNGSGTFDAHVDTLQHARRNLVRLLETHQAYIHEQPKRRYEPLLTSVYSDLHVEYPGLSAIAEAIDRVRTTELCLWVGFHCDESTSRDGTLQQLEY